MSVALLLLALQAGPIPASPSAAQLRSAVRTATRAVEKDSAPAALKAALLRRDPVSRLTAATLYRHTYDYASADRMYRELLAAYPSPSPVHAYAQLGLGTSLTVRWQFAAAIRALTDAVLEAQQVNDPAGAADGMLFLSTMVGRQGLVDSAYKLIVRADSLAKGSDAALYARSRCSLGGLMRGRAPLRADSLVVEGIGLAAAAGDERVRGNCLMTYAMVWEARGFQNTANDTLGTATDVLRRARDRHALAAAMQLHTYITTNYSATFWRGVATARAAITGGAATGNTLAAAWARLNLAQLASRVGDFASSRIQADSARLEMLTLGDKPGEAASEYVIGEAALLGGEYARAERAFRNADSLNAMFGATGARAAIALRTAALLRLTGRADSSAAVLARMQETVRSLKLIGLENDARYEEGMQAMARGDWASAAERFTAFSTRVSGEKKIYESGWHIRLDADARTAEALARLGRFDAAQEVLDSGLIRMFKRRLYWQYGDREGQIALLQARRFDFDSDLGIATIVNLFARGGRVEPALQIAEAWRAQYLNAAEGRRLSLLPDTMASRKAADTLARTLLPSVDRQTELLSRLPDSTALLMYSTGRGNEPTTLFVGLRDTIAAFTLQAADSLALPIARFGAALEGGNPPPGSAAALGAALLGPAERMLPARISRLIIVPDGPLHRVPFDALELNGKRVLERFAVSLAPSLRLAAQWWNAPAPAPRRALVLADPVFPRASGMARLVGSGSEAQSIGRLVPGARVMARAAATPGALASAARNDVGLLHLATHAEVQDRGLLSSALFLSPDGDSDGRLDVAKIAALQLRDALVVLSSCRTLGGAIVNGEGLQGLTTPFMEAGARAIVATHWAVGDQAVRRLMEDFYRALSRGADVVSAARAAKLASLRRGEPASAWASLAVVGDGGMKPRVF